MKKFTINKDKITTGLIATGLLITSGTIASMFLGKNKDNEEDFSEIEELTLGDEIVEYEEDNEEDEEINE